MCGDFTWRVSDCEEFLGSMDSNFFFGIRKVYSQSTDSGLFFPRISLAPRWELR